MNLKRSLPCGNLSRRKLCIKTIDTVDIIFSIECSCIFHILPLTKISFQKRSALESSRKCKLTKHRSDPSNWIAITRLPVERSCSKPWAVQFYFNVLEDGCDLEFWRCRVIDICNQWCLVGAIGIHHFLVIPAKIQNSNHETDPPWTNRDWKSRFCATGHSRVLAEYHLPLDHLVGSKKQDASIGK
jgi:hypothetical protein